MKNSFNRLDDSAVNKVTGGAGPNRLAFPSPSIESLPCESSLRTDLTECPHTEADKLCYNCEGCRLNILAKPLGR